MAEVGEFPRISAKYIPPFVLVPIPNIAIWAADICKELWFIREFPRLSCGGNNHVNASALMPKHHSRFDLFRPIALRGLFRQLCANFRDQSFRLCQPRFIVHDFPKQKRPLGESRGDPHFCGTRAKEPDYPEESELSTVCSVVAHTAMYQISRRISRKSSAPAKFPEIFPPLAF